MLSVQLLGEAKMIRSVLRGVDVVASVLVVLYVVLCETSSAVLPESLISYAIRVQSGGVELIALYIITTAVVLCVSCILISIHLHRFWKPESLIPPLCKGVCVMSVIIISIAVIIYSIHIGLSLALGMHTYSTVAWVGEVISTTLIVSFLVRMWFFVSVFRMVPK